MASSVCARGRVVFDAEGLGELLLVLNPCTCPLDGTHHLFDHCQAALGAAHLRIDLEFDLAEDVPGPAAVGHGDDVVVDLTNWSACRSNQHTVPDRLERDDSFESVLPYDTREDAARLGRHDIGAPGP